MATMKLKVRYFMDSTPLAVPCREENFKRRELDFPIPVEQRRFANLLLTIGVVVEGGAQ